MLDKNKIKNAVIELLEIKIAELSEIVHSSIQSVTSADNKQESKYDTRAIEASYIAGAQKARLEQIKKELILMNRLNVSFSDSVIKVGSFVEVLKDDKEKKFFFFTPHTGGESIKIDSVKITIMSLSNPLSIEFLGLEEGDDFIFEETDHQYEVIKVS